MAVTNMISFENILLVLQVSNKCGRCEYAMGLILLSRALIQYALLDFRYTNLFY